MSEGGRNPASTSLSGRVLAGSSIALVGLLTIVAILVGSGVRDIVVDRVADDVTQQARLVAFGLDAGADLESDVDAQAALIDARITVIGADGVVLADSVAEAAQMDDHSTRPEVVEALAGDVGVSRRLSATTGERRLYVALPVESGRVIRLSVTESAIDESLGALSSRVVGTLLIVGLLGFGLLLATTRRVVRPISELTDLASRVADGELDVRTRRSSVLEFDRLGLAIGRMAGDLGRRITESDAERQTLDVVLEALPDAIVLVEPGDDIAYANGATESILGPVPERLGGLAPPALQRLVRSARAAGRVERERIEHGTPTRQLTCVVTPFDEPEPRVLIVVSDVTERSRVEAMRRDFVADASHELKTPVAAILAAAEALAMALERGSDRAPAFAAQVESSARRLARIVEDLLDLSRLESSEAPHAEVDLAAVVEEEAERHRPLADARRIAFETQVVPATVVGSRADLSLAVRNLCDNAIRYTDEGGRVEVRLAGDEATVTVEVSDTGSGIPTRALPRVFERFYRVDVARARETGGTGLGLAIVKHVAERHGGSVSVTSQLGVGSTFRMTLPAP